jgi:ubiquinone/menaquinone biosynthesis C-methylase UbiE
MAWWLDYFDETFFQLHEDLFPEEESRYEVASILELLGLPTDSRILDLPCGWGRHTLLFPTAGQDAFGADLSVDLLSRAVATARDEGMPRRFAAADIRELPFRDESFDAVLNIFTSLGLFLEDREDIRALAEAHRVLRPGGQFLLESMHRDDVVCTYAERDRWTLPNGIEVRVRRRFDPVTGISYERLRWRRGEEEGRKSHALKLRTATEIDGLLRAAGFEEIRYYGDWTGEPLRHDSPRVIAVAKKDGDL